MAATARQWGGQPQTSLTVAESAPEIAGFVCFVFDQEREFGTYLHNIYVSPGYQRRGVASGLLAAGVDAFSTTHNQGPVHLLVFLENWPARAFYDRLGDRVVEEIQRARAGNPAVKLVRYQWASAQEMKKSAQSLAR